MSEANTVKILRRICREANLSEANPPAAISGHGSPLVRHNTPSLILLRSLDRVSPPFHLLPHQRFTTKAEEAGDLAASVGQVLDGDRPLELVGDLSVDFSLEEIEEGKVEHGPLAHSADALVVGQRVVVQEQSGID